MGIFSSFRGKRAGRKRKVKTEDINYKDPCCPCFCLTLFFFSHSLSLAEKFSFSIKFYLLDTLYRSSQFTETLSLPPPKGSFLIQTHISLTPGLDTLYTTYKLLQRKPHKHKMDVNRKIISKTTEIFRSNVEKNS